jgi:hypothetical protein
MDRRRVVVTAFAVLAAVSQPCASRAQSAGDASLAGGANNAISNMQNALMADPASRDQVLSLGDDAQVQAILNDPATMRAVQSGDLNALMNDPKLKALLQNPTVRALVQQQSR